MAKTGSRSQIFQEVCKANRHLVLDHIRCPYRRKQLVNIRAKFFSMSRLGNRTCPNRKFRAKCLSSGYLELVRVLFKSDNIFFSCPWSMFLQLRTIRMVSMLLGRSVVGMCGACRKRSKYVRDSDKAKFMKNTKVDYRWGGKMVQCKIVESLRHLQHHRP